MDTNPDDGVNYYRIKQVDKDGQVSYSQAISVRFNFRKIEIFPNPASNKIYIRNNSNFSNNQKLKIQLLDFSGKVLFNKISEPTSNIITVNISPKISNGMYLLIVTNSKGEKQGDKVWITR